VNSCGFTHYAWKLLQTFVLLAALPSLALGVTAEESKKIPRFESDILPIFQANCLVCHGESVKQKGLDLRTRDSVLKGGESASAIVPGASQESLLFQKISSGAMPLGGNKLSVEEVQVIQRWIDSGGLREGEDPESVKKQTKGKEVSEREIMVNVFEAKCISCHGKWRQDGGLDLRTRASLLKGGKSGPAVVPGKPEESLLFKRIASAEMPPSQDIYGDGQYVKRVSADEMDKLRQWIAAGASSVGEDSPEVKVESDPLVKESDRKFWSFQPPSRPSVPQVSNSQMVRTPIDAFLLEKLEAKGLKFSPEQERLALMRRAYFDLIGLPPSLEEVQSYLNDSHPDAYEQMIDRLLASPRYGERWGKYWLDAAGYADSHGKIDPDRVRPHAWRYRDYVIRSLNTDKPYNQFLVEQIAGDELFDYKATKQLTAEQQDNLIATGFLRTAADDTDEGAQNFIPYRMAVLSDQVQIFSSAVMGLTMECARCHSHKYDPLPQRDYYRMTAIFQTAYDPYDWRIPSSAFYAGAKTLDLPDEYQRFLPYVSEKESRDAVVHNQPIQGEIKRLENSLDVKAKPLREKLLEEKLSKVPEPVRRDLVKALEKPADERSVLDKYLLERFEGTIKVEPKELEEKFRDFQEESGRVRKAIKEARSKLVPEPKIQALFDMGGEPTPTYIARRGDYRFPADRVSPGVPSVLADGITPYRVIKPSWTTATSGRRLALARWLVQPKHPLTARVEVNRIWQQHFGKGLVVTPANFGKIGARPTHPELLDWLATEFVRQDWSIKAMHKLIMTSNAYRQSSLVGPDVHGADPDNVLLSRFPLRRLDAEAIRDSILKVAGRLDSTPFGPAEEIEVTPENEVVSKGVKTGFRRSIYLLQRRSTPLTMLELFDAPRMDPNCLQRAYSTVPTQALQLWNSEMTRESSRYFAGRVIDAVGDDLEQQIERVYLLALSRRPTVEESRLGREALTGLNRDWLEHLEKDIPAEPKSPRARWLALATFCHVVLNSPQFVYVD
jgi:mono/diheme cytochrome c family protein